MSSAGKILSTLCIGQVVCISLGLQVLDYGSDFQISFILVLWSGFSGFCAIYLHRTMGRIAGDSWTLGQRFMVVIGYVVALPSVLIAIVVVYLLLTFTGHLH